MCPLKSWASTIKRILKDKNGSIESTINTVFIEGEKLHFTSKMIIESLWAATEKLGEKDLGFSSSEIGTHSIRSGGVMAMHLGKIQP